MRRGSKFLPHQCTRSTNGRGGQSGYVKWAESATVSCSISTMYVMKPRLITKNARISQSIGRARSGIGTLAFSEAVRGEAEEEYVRGRRQRIDHEGAVLPPAGV